MKFTKMHGLGNDYIYLNCLEQAPGDLSGLAVRLSDRHFGVGADGLICIFPSEIADFRMEMYNADGSVGEMCGNGIRCLAKYVYDKGLTGKRQLAVETRAGVKHLSLRTEGGKVASVTVDMGAPVFQPPLDLTIRGEDYRVYPVSMGNPHAVVYVDCPQELDLALLGPCFEHHPAFPNRTNTEFVRVQGRDALSMRVWERGSGETLACGTGACAAAAVSASLGLTRRTVLVSLPGGNLSVSWSEADDHIYMTGPAVTVFEGEMEDGQH